MEEYKIIPQAPDYKINRNEEVIRTINGKPLLALAGGKVLLKKPDGTMQSFMTADLVNEIFGNEDTKGQLRSQVVDFVESNKVIVQSETNPSGDFVGPITYVNLTAEEQKELEKEINTSNDTNPTNNDNKPKGKSKREKFVWTFIGKTGAGKSPKGMEKKKDDESPKTFTATKEVAKIIELDCSESMKIWKLHQAGCSNEEILAHLKLPKEKSKKCNNTIWNYKHSPSMRKKADLK